MIDKTKDQIQMGLEYIINNKQIKTVFQPIISLIDGETLGHEALSRITCDSIIENIEVLFHAAEEYKYKGTVTIKDLLLKTTEIEISMAKHQNPLSELLGNVIIEQKLSQCTSGDCEYSVAYLDIDNFKAYNDVYGFENGDLVLLLLSNILKSDISGEDFVGHIGGDDFVVVLNEHAEVDYFAEITRKFETEVLNLYNRSDLEKGYITTANRHGVVEKFPIITLTTVVTNNQMQAYKNQFELTKELAYLKKLAKQKKVRIS